MVETLILHGGSRVTWRDAATVDLADPGEALQAMQPVGARLRFVRDPDQAQNRPPDDLCLVHKSGAMTLLRRSAGAVVSRAPEPADYAPPAGVGFTLRGVVVDDAWRYLPRILELDFPAAGADRNVAVFPSPQSVVRPNGGMLRGTLLYDADERPAAWARVDASVTVGARDLLFRAQANASGEFALPLFTVPPLQDGIDPYPTTLTVSAESAAQPILIRDPRTQAMLPVADPDALTPTQLGEVGVTYPGDAAAADDPNNPLVFTADATFQVRPGETGILRSRGRTYVALAAA